MEGFFDARERAGERPVAFSRGGGVLSYVIPGRCEFTDDSMLATLAHWALAQVYE